MIHDVKHELDQDKKERRTLLVLRVFIFAMMGVFIYGLVVS
jgi:hypothetical protein